DQEAYKQMKDRTDFGKMIQWSATAEKGLMLVNILSEFEIGVRMKRIDFHSPQGITELKQELSTIRAEHGRILDDAKREKYVEEMTPKLRKALKAPKDSTERKAMLTEMEHLEAEVKQLIQVIYKQFDK